MSVYFFRLNYSSGISILIMVADVLIDSLFIRFVSMCSWPRPAFTVRWTFHRTVKAGRSTFMIGTKLLSMYQGCAMCTNIVNRKVTEHARRLGSEVGVVPLTSLYLSLSDLLCIIYILADSS